MNISPDLLHTAGKGNRTAQYQLYQVCYPVLMSVCRRYRSNEDEAAAALNDCFLRILQNLHRYQAEVPFVAWIRRIQINILTDLFRKEAKWRSQVSLVESVEQQSDALLVDWNEADQQYDAEQLENLLLQLPPVSRQVFNLFALDGYSHAEIGAMLGISEGTSKWHVSSARSQLRRWINAGLEQHELTTVTHGQ